MLLTCIHPYLNFSQKWGQRQWMPGNTLIKMALGQIKVCLCLGCSGLLWTVLRVLIIFYLSTTINLQQRENPLHLSFHIWPWRIKPSVPGSPWALQEWAKNKPSITVLNESILDTYPSPCPSPKERNSERWYEASVYSAWLITTVNYQGPHEGARLGWGGTERLCCWQIWNLSAYIPLYEFLNTRRGISRVDLLPKPVWFSG